jgi:hypothetical protein
MLTEVSSPNFHRHASYVELMTLMIIFIDGRRKK